MVGNKKPLGRWKWGIITAVILVIVAVPLIIYIAADREQKELNDSTRSQLGGSYIRLSNGVTHYQLAGPPGGKVIVLIHGATIPMYIWDAQFQPLADAGFRVLRYDMFGKGYSDRPEASYDQAFYRKQLIELLDALNIKQPVDLVGISMGGGTAIDFTASYPERVRRLVLAAPLINSIKNDGNIKILRPPVWGEFLCRLIAVNSITTRAGELMKQFPNPDAYVLKFKEQTYYKGFERALLSMFRSDANGDYTADYIDVARQGDRKIMLIWGTEDGDITYAMIQQIRNYIIPTQYVQLDGIGHDPQVEVPEFFNGLVINFLKQ